MNRILSILLCTALLLIPAGLQSQSDYSHYSEVFKREKPYRVFLPEDYSSSGKSYPVIYYFHGNTGTHIPRLTDVFAKLVKDNPVILVSWNGRSVDSDKRPYNIGFHSNINYETQFKDYFPELVEEVDSKFRTLTDRSNRALIGHSMGGIMSFFIAGMYPDMVGTAVNSKGSPEFFIGYPENHSLYHVRHMFMNMHGINLRFHNSTVGELVHLNDEVHAGALQEGGLSYEYEVYEGGHSLKEVDFTDAFNFVMKSFENPAQDVERWHHANLYSDFDIRGYEVRSNKSEPGFIEMTGVTKGGMRIATRKWEPFGPAIPGVKIDVRTAPIYEKNATYTLRDYNETRDELKQYQVESDREGRLAFKVNHESHQIGIAGKKAAAEIVFLDHKVNGKGIFLDHQKECVLNLHLLNRGGKTGKKLKVELSCNNPDVVVDKQVLEMDELEPGLPLWTSVGFRVRADNLPPADGSPFRLKFHLKVSDKKNTWVDEFEVPVMYDVPEFTKLGIDDGDSEIYGSGNGNNIAEPGEELMIYEISYVPHRTRLYYDDPYVDGERLHVDLQPDKWGDGYALSSVVHISEDCPPGHKIKFLARYEVKEWKAINRLVTWGTFTITVGGEE